MQLREAATLSEDQLASRLLEFARKLGPAFLRVDAAYDRLVVMA
jgi:hypothetical protein